MASLSLHQLCLRIVSWLFQRDSHTNYHHLRYKLALISILTTFLTEMIEISIGWSGEFEGSETDVIKGLVVNTIGFVCIFDQLMNRQSGVVWLYHGVRNLSEKWLKNHWRRKLWLPYLRWWKYWECIHDSIGVFFANFGDQKCSQPRSCSSTKRVSQLKALQTVASFGFFSHNFQNLKKSIEIHGIFYFWYGFISLTESTNSAPSV